MCVCWEMRDVFVAGKDHVDVLEACEEICPYEQG